MTYTARQRDALIDAPYWPHDIGRLIAGYAAPDAAERLLFLLLDTPRSRLHILVSPPGIHGHVVSFWITWQWRDALGMSSNEKMARLCELRHLRFWVSVDATPFACAIAFNSLLRGIERGTLNRMAAAGTGDGWLLNRRDVGVAISDRMRQLLRRY